MFQSNPIRGFLLAACLVTAPGLVRYAPAGQALEGWTTASPRDEIRPDFGRDERGGPDGQPCLVISAAGRVAVDGAWVKTFSIQGGGVYRFSVLRKTDGVRTPRRSAVVEITWQDQRGRLVPSDVADLDDKARPEYPADLAVREDGWTVVSGVYRVPKAAAQARIALHLRWTGGEVRWCDWRLEHLAQWPRRIVRLAAVHFRPQAGRTPAEKREQFAPLVAEAARRGADLVCLPESLTYYGSGRAMADAAEPIPGPSTEYFGRLAKAHDLYIVAGLTERAGPVIYNTAVLVGPDGHLVGKYRKVCLPREEIAAGITPGDAYPVFQTRFGKVGIMICWDVHFPEVARNLSNRGAEVIALPIWGGNPVLAAARAIENQIYLVTSTYTDLDRDWMRTGIWDRRGKLMAQAERWGEVVVAEVDLAEPTYWQWLGDFRARIERERPAAGFQE